MVVKRRKTGLILFIVLLAALLAGAGIFLFRQLTDVDGRDTFLRGTTVNGVNVAGMTLDQAEEALRTAVDRYQLKIRFADGTRRLSAEDLELTLTGREPLRKLLREQKRKAAEPKDELFDNFDDFDRLEAESAARDEAEKSEKFARKPFKPDRPSRMKQDEDIADAPEITVYHWFAGENRKNRFIELWMPVEEKTN